MPYKHRYIVLLTLKVAVYAVAVKVVLSNWCPPIKSGSGQPSGTNHTTVSGCRHCDGEVVTNGHIVFITLLVSVSKIQAFLRTFCTVRYIDDAKRYLYVTDVLRCLTI